LEWITQLNWVDFLVFFIFLSSLYVGSQRGLFGELFYLVGLYFIVIISVSLSYPLAHFLNTYAKIPISASYLTGCLLIVLVLYFSFMRLYTVLLKVVKIDILQGINSTGGIIVGFFRAFIICILVVYMILLVPFSYVSDSVNERSASGRFFVTAGISLYKKSMALFSEKQSGKFEQLLEAVRPVKFEKIRIKRKERIERFLEE